MAKAVSKQEDAEMLERWLQFGVSIVDKEDELI